MELEFHTLDVFTAEPLGGNPLAVVLGADGLGDRLMQQVAREFNLSETVFVLDAKENAPDAVPVRIFTPRSEMPFAGHPVIGTGVLLAELRHMMAARSRPG
jgi:trans-2,3-dihydro-3-hydroxyanthranilate isomerase